MRAACPKAQGEQNGGHDPGLESLRRLPLDRDVRPAFGRTADRYFDKYRFESDPSLLAAIVEELAPLVPRVPTAWRDSNWAVSPIATLLSARTGPADVLRPQAGQEVRHGEDVRGGDIRGMRLLIVEDVVTTGGQILLSAQDLRAEGAVGRTTPVRDRPGGGWRGQGRRRRDRAARPLHDVRSRIALSLRPLERPAPSAAGK